MNPTPHISVCIPAYDMGGYGDVYLSKAFETLLMQSFKDFEVVVADQSDNGAVEQVCQAYSVKMPITHVDNRSGMRRASANTNFAMRQARGRIHKILFQDDFLCQENALGELAKAFSFTGFRWCVCGSGITRDGETIEAPMVPAYHDHIRFGRNTISSPSVLALDAEQEMFFDEELVWLMDVDMYHRCNANFGPPLVLPETLVANRLHDGQVSNSIDPELRRKELAYIKRKHGVASFKDRQAYFWQKLKAGKV